MQRKSTAEHAEHAEKAIDGASREALSLACSVGSVGSACSAVDLLCIVQPRNPPGSGRTSYVRSLHDFVLQFIPECLVQPREVGSESNGEHIPRPFQIDLPHR